jgi:hypothetical protein
MSKRLHPAQTRQDTFLARERYQQACAAYDAAFTVWHPIPALYRNRTIGDAQYLAARKVFDAAKDEWESARAAAYPGT